MFSQLSFAGLAELPSPDVFLHTMNEHPVLFIGLAVGVSVVLAARYVHSPWRKLPPGPPADPILGHLRIFPRLNQSEKFYEWSKQYGKLSFLSVVQSRAEGAFDRGCHSP